MILEVNYCTSAQPNFRYSTGLISYFIAHQSIYSFHLFPACITTRSLN